MNKKVLKARQLLDHRKYHLNQSYDGVTETWKLYEKYDSWLKDGSKPIMSSETHTNDELLKFARQNKKYQIFDFYTILILILTLIMFILLFISLYLNNTFLRGLYYGVILSIWIIIIIFNILSRHNHKVFYLELERCKERFIKSINKKYNIKK